MQKSGWSAAIVSCASALALAGCAATPRFAAASKHETGEQTCPDDGQPCAVDIKVDFISGACDFTLPGTVYVDGTSRADRTMRWTLQPQTPWRVFKFEKVDGPGNWGQQFGPSKVVSDRVVEVINRRSATTGTYSYVLTVWSAPWWRPSAFTPCGADPVIVNRG